MHPCSIPDAEADGKDSNNRPQQLCVSNGEAGCCLILFLKKTYLVINPVSFDLFRQTVISSQ